MPACTATWVGSVDKEGCGRGVHPPPPRDGHGMHSCFSFTSKKMNAQDRKHFTETNDKTWLWDVALKSWNQLSEHVRSCWSTSTRSSIGEVATLTGIVTINKHLVHNHVNVLLLKCLSLLKPFFCLLSRRFIIFNMTLKWPSPASPFYRPCDAQLRMCAEDVWSVYFVILRQNVVRFLQCLISTRETSAPFVVAMLLD